MSFPELQKKIDYLNPSDKKLIQRAYEFASKVHQHQKRFTGEPFVSHSLETAAFIADLKLDASAIAAAILHDTCEDTDCDIPKIRRAFGKKIAFLVDGVTKLGKIRIRRRWLFLRDEKELKAFDRQVETFRKMFMAMAQDIRVVIIKLADRRHNMRTLQGVPEEKRLPIAQETMEIYAPLADRLGMGELTGELEDMAFSYIMPQEYQNLKNRTQPLLADKEKNIEALKKIILKELKKAKIPAEVRGRKKHIYSLWLKLKRYDNDLSRIYDLLALRIMVDSVEDCYQVLGIIHEMWRPLVGKIKDYIAMPKPNGYQSIHTTVFTKEAGLIEIQIRTKEMHDRAENGIASHWHYTRKKGTLDYLRRKTTPLGKKELRWIQELSRWQKHLSDNQEILDNLGLDFFSDRIFVYTPKGDVKDLPLGATVIDFAFAVHTDLGRAIAGAKVNGKIAKISTPLKNGDIVEIIKSKKAVPKRDWLEIVKTSLARNRIRQFLKRNN